jgi:hypothetical protein
MSPIFQDVPEEGRSVQRTAAQVVTEPLQVIPEEEELNLNLKSNTPRQPMYRQLSKSEYPSYATLSMHRSPASACHRHSACPSSIVHLSPSTHVPVGTLYPFPKPSRNEFQSDLLFSGTQFGKASGKPDPLNAETSTYPREFQASLPR